MVEKLGVVIASEEGPSPSRIDFVVTGGRVRQGQFVELEYEEGRLLALVEDVRKVNRYYENAEIVKEYETRSSVGEQFPAGEWEFLLGVARPLAVLREDTIERPTYPPSPGTPVFEPSAKDLKRFLGLPENGLLLGELQFHDVPFRVDMDRLVQKHFAILAMSGSGKSYLTSVIIEELLDRRREDGRIGIVVFDVHGEYRGFAEPPTDPSYVDYSTKTIRIPASQVRIGVSLLSPETLMGFMPGLSDAQKRLLRDVLDTLRRRMEDGAGPYDVDDIIREVEALRGRVRNENTRLALLSWLRDLKRKGIFAKLEHPSVLSLVRPGKLVIFDLSDITEMSRKQLIVAYFARRLFELRRQNQVPPLLLIVEEAHQFIPEGKALSEVLARPILETIAREGRKFGLGLCLISQRPVRLSTTALSQCNTHIILRMTNPYDLDHVKRSSEGIDDRSIRMITTLRVGEALMVGEAVKFPVFFRVRRRRSQEYRFGVPLSEMARRWEEEHERLKNDLESL